ncbi:hypothetical protein KR222_005531 [Zaprionus bogoriensis]|nr:hypothetical protein KR222_005531 [Zaprionus bogoriensis]
MLHNNANWLPPHQTPQQQQQPPQPQQQQQQQLQQQQQAQPPGAPQQQQQQLYASQMFQQPTPQQQYWPEEQQQQPLNNYNYYAPAAAAAAAQSPPQQAQLYAAAAVQQPQAQLYAQPQPQPQLYAASTPPQAQLYAAAAAPELTTPQFYQPAAELQQQQQQQQLPAEVFDNNNSSSKNDGWGDWGDWNDNNNASSNNNSIITSNNNSNNNNNNIINHSEAPTPSSAVEDAFNVQGQSSWHAFGNNNNTTTSSSSSTAEVAKPLELPPLLSPASEPLSVVAEPELNAIVPPRAFQNQPPAVAAAAPPTAAAPPPLLPPTLEAGASAAGNSFKRVGGLNKRINILAGTSPAAAPPTTVAAAAPPAALLPTSGVQLLLPEPSAEQPQQYENQEVLLAAPNDERAQYLQTSHLSEQPEELGESNWEADGLLPPPGLSRLVLGQPELVEQQRLVTGTEQPQLHSVPNALHMAERQADGEDTSDGEQQQQQQLPPTTTTTTRSDLYQQQQQQQLLQQQQQQQPLRVVTGVETTSSTVVLSGEQREVVLDGENLEDQRPIVAPPAAAHVAIAAAAAAAPPTPAAVAAVEQEADTHHINHEQHEEEQQQQQQQQQQLPPAPLEKMKHTRASRSVDLESDYESEDEWLLLSDRHEPPAPPRRQPDERSMRSVRSSRRHYSNNSNNNGNSNNNNHNYEGETEDSLRGVAGVGVVPVAGAGHNESLGSSKSTRESKRRTRDAEGQRRHEAGERGGRERSEREREWEREKERERQHERERERERERHRNLWRREEHKPERRSRYNNNNNSNSNYDGESDVGDVVPHAAGGGVSDGGGGGGGGRSSKASRQRRSAAADDDYEDYEQQQHQAPRGGSHYQPRRDKQHEKLRGGRRSHEGSERGRERRDRERERERGHWDARDYEEYRGKSSRNSDLEKERINGGGGGGGGGRRRNQDPYAAQPGAAYDPYAMYEQMMRNPQSYADMYAKVYGHMMMTAVMNAATQKPDAAGKAVAAQQPQSLPHLHQVPHGHVAGIGVDPSSKSIAALGSNEAALLRERERAIGAVTTTYEADGIATTTTTVASPPRRRTPPLYNRPHLVASYSMSLLLRVRPKYVGRGRLRNDVEVSAPRIKDATSSLLRAYPGPLQGRNLHKDKIISFCKEQIRLGPARACTVLYATQKKPQGSVDKYRASHALMWHLLILLLRQNGVIADTDVGDLLLENQREYPYAPDADTDSNEPPAESGEDGEAAATAGPSATAAADAEEADAEQVDADAGVGADAAAASAGATSMSEQEATDQFRSYVLRGNVEEALQWATDHNLWTHAFFLALYEDRYALTDVAQKFLNRAIKANDPLQTLYQMKSCHTPACVSQLRDEHWGDWRSHLSILVTNKSRQPEYDRSSVVSLGDTLFQRGDIYAAHFCYLVAQEEFGRYDSSATELTTLTGNVPRLILLGASHYKPFNEFASNEAIIMTEIYEYARSLFDHKFSIVNFQHYKYLLATRILDYGQHFRCTNYLEQIAKHIELKPDSYDGDFIQRVCGLAERLRYHDPILINRVSFASPPSASNGAGQAAPQVGAPEEKEWLCQLRSLADQVSVVANGDQLRVYTKYIFNVLPLQQTQQQSQHLQLQQLQQQQQSEIDQQFVDLNKQMRELNMQYDEPQQEAQQQQQQQQQLQLQQQQQQQQLLQPQNLQQEYYEPPQQQQQQPSAEQTLNSETYAPQMYYDPNAAAAQQQQQQPQPQPPQLFDPSQQQQQQLQPAVYGHIEPASEAYGEQAAVGGSYGATAATTTGYDYWPSNMQQPYGDEQQHARPTISMPKSKSYDDDDGAAAAAAADTSASATVAGGKQQQQQQQQAAAAAGLPGTQGGGNQNAGWFGGLWNKFSLKPKNQMILPDDKNPTIVWDKERKCWTNTEGNADEAEAFKPPPKMSDMGTVAAAVAATVAAAPTPTATPNLHELPNVNLYEQQQQQQQPPQQPEYDYSNYGEQQYAPAAAAAATVPTAAATIPTVAATIPTAAATTPTAAAAAGGAQPKLQSNMFKIKRNRTLKNSYVDVFNPSGAPMSSTPQTVLAPLMAPVAVPQGGFFVPGAVPAQQQQQPQ